MNFIWDYRRKRKVSSEDHNLEDDLSANILKTFLKDLCTLHTEVCMLQTSHIQMAEIENANLLQTALITLFGSWLCGIWDVWEPLDVKPGDIGYIIRGKDKLRPEFELLFNTADEAEDDPIDSRIDMEYVPSTGWTSNQLEPGLVR